MKFRQTLGFRIFLSFFSVILLVLGSLVSFAYYRGSTALRAAAVAYLVETRGEKEAALNAWFSNSGSDISSHAASPTVREATALMIAAPPNSPQAREAHDRLIAELVVRTGPESICNEFSVIEVGSGKIIASTAAGQEGKWREDRPYFLRGLGETYVQPPVYSMELQTPVMYIATPIREAGGRTLGVLAGRLNIAQMNAIIGRRSGTHGTDDAFLVNDSHLFVTQPRQISDPLVLRRGVYTEAVNRCLAGGTGVASAKDYRGVPSIIAYRWLAKHRLGLIVKIDEAEALKPIRRFGWYLVLISALVFLLAAAMSMVLTRTFLNPILELQEGVVRFTHGERGVRVNESRRDELGILARAFNIMSDTLTENELRLHRKSEELKESSALLEARAKEIEALNATLERRIEERTADLVRVNENLQTALEELGRSNTELEQFAYVASHDLQEPLRTVASYVQLLKRKYNDRLDDDAREFIGFAVDGATRMKTLIDDLLTYSRIGTKGKEFEPADGNVLLDQAMANLRLAIEESRAVITHDPLPTVRADGEQIVQVFQNLLTNAIRFHGAQPPRIHVSARSAHRQWIFSVRDNGIGIAPEYHQKIFIIFQRLHIRDKYPGTGIGLAICKKIIERHGGRVWVESEPREGATFFFSIPVRNDVK